MTTERWSDVGERVKARMLERGLGPVELARLAGKSTETLRPILNGRPGNYRPATLARLSTALGWPADRIAQILDGTAPADEPEGEDRLRRLEERADLIEARLAEILRRLGGEG